MFKLTNNWLSGGNIAKIWIFSIFAPFVSLVWLFCVIPAILLSRFCVSNWTMFSWAAFSLLASLTTWSMLILSYIKMGSCFILSLLILIWFTDTSAYFFGRYFGRYQLVPRISYRKTVEGALASLIASILWIGISSIYHESFAYLISLYWSTWLIVPIAILLGIFSIIGDLFGSLLKRRAGRKDSGILLPGHGGFYDRTDAVFSVVPIALLLSGVKI